MWFQGLSTRRPNWDWRIISRKDRRAAPSSPVLLARMLPSLHRLMRTLAGLGILAKSSGAAFRSDRSGPCAEVGRAELRKSGRDVLRRPSDTERVGSAAPLRPGPAPPVLPRRTGCRSLTISRSTPRTRRVSAKRWSTFMVRGPPRSRLPIDSPGSARSSTYGGATGNLLAAFLTKHVGPRGVLFDRAHVVAQEAPALLQGREVRGAVAIETGDFFEGVPPTGDAYICPTSGTTGASRSASRS